MISLFCLLCFLNDNNWSQFQKNYILWIQIECNDMYYCYPNRQQLSKRLVRAHTLSDLLSGYDNIKICRVIHIHNMQETSGQILLQWSEKHD